MKKSPQNSRLSTRIRNTHHALRRFHSDPGLKAGRFQALGLLATSGRTGRHPYLVDQFGSTRPGKSPPAPSPLALSGPIPWKRWDHTNGLGGVNHPGLPRKNRPARPAAQHLPALENSPRGPDTNPSQGARRKEVHSLKSLPFCP